MTYTAQDLGNQRAAGMEDARLDAGEKLLALVDDTVRKLESSEPYDSGTVMEDLLGRLVEISDRFGADVDLFGASTKQFQKKTYAYEILGPVDHEFEADHSPGAYTVMVERGGYGDACGLPPEAHGKGEKR
jgi:hypothetical protein